jgi:predicted nucleotidyltransferase
MARKRKQIAKWRIPAITPIGSDKPVSETLPIAVKRIARELKPEKIILFGSYAYGKPTGDSDVDLLVVMNTNERSQIKRCLPVMRAITSRDFATDVIVRTPTEIDESLSRGSSFIHDVVTRGRVLYERRK